MDKKIVSQTRDDRILSLTRIVSAATVPFLIAAWIIFYLFPTELHDLLPWDITPTMTAAFFGAGYLAGAYQLVFAVFEKRWHRVMNGFLPITSFSIFMLISTILHADKFDFSRFPSIVWTAIYVLAPIFFLLVWFRNRGADSGTPESMDAIVPSLLRTGLALIAAGLMLFSVVTLITPTLTIQYWPWNLTPLTARVLAGWFSLLGLGGLIITRETRWSGWRIPIQSIFLWNALVLIAVFRNREDMTNNTSTLFLAMVVLSTVVLLGLLIYMETLRQRKVGQK